MRRGFDVVTNNTRVSECFAMDSTGTVLAKVRKVYLDEFIRLFFVLIF